MKRTFSMLAFFFLLTALGGPLAAENFKNKAGGVSIWLPDEWEIDSEESLDALYADAVDGSSFCVLQVLVKKNDLPAALKAFRAPLDEEVDDFATMREIRKSKLNGMDAYLFGGEGLRDDKTWWIDVALIATREAVMLCAVGWEKGLEGKMIPLQEKIFASIQRLD